MNHLHIVEWRPNIYVAIMYISPVRMLISKMAYGRHELPHAAHQHDSWNEVILTGECNKRWEWIDDGEYVGFRVESILSKVSMEEEMDLILRGGDRCCSTSS